MSDCRKCIRCMKGVVPPAGQVLKIIWLTVWITLGTMFGTYLIAECYRAYAHARSDDIQAAERADRIIDDLDTMKQTLRAFMSFYTESLENLRLGVRLFDGSTEEVIGEFITRPDGAFKSRFYTAGKNSADRVSRQVKAAGDKLNANAGDYIITATDNGHSLYVGFKLNDNERNITAVKRRLTAKSSLRGLLGSDGKSRYNQDNVVYMLVDEPQKSNASPNRNRTLRRSEKTAQ